MRQIINPINTTLRHNRIILSQLCLAQKMTVSRDELLSRGFDFSSFTTIRIFPGRRVFYFVYDYAYTPLRENSTEKALIIRCTANTRYWNPWKYIKSAPNSYGNGQDVS